MLTDDKLFQNFKKNIISTELTIPLHENVQLLIFSYSQFQEFIIQRNTQCLIYIHLCLDLHNVECLLFGTSEWVRQLVRFRYYWVFHLQYKKALVERVAYFQNRRGNILSKKFELKLIFIYE